VGRTIGNSDDRLVAFDFFFGFRKTQNYEDLEPTGTSGGFISSSIEGVIIVDGGRDIYSDTRLGTYGGG